MTIAKAGSIRFQVFAGASVPIALLLIVTIARFGTLSGISATALLIASLFAHEAGHCFSAALTDTKVSEIGLCLHGAYLRRQHANGLSEFLISASGVLVNAAIAAALWDSTGILLWVAQMNAVLVAVNLLPVGGTDGRRMLGILRSWYKSAAPSKQAVSLS